MTTYQTGERGAQTRPAPRGSADRKGQGRVVSADAFAAWTLMTPALALFTVFISLPALAAVVLSFFKWRFLDSPTFVGFDNYVRMLGDEQVWQSLKVTFIFVALGVIPTVTLGFMVAVMLNVALRGIGLLRVLYFVPVVLSVAVSAVLWRFIYDARQGPVGALLSQFGITMPDVLNSTHLAAPALVIIMIWMALPIVILLYLAALQRVPTDIYDAAALDGAGPWQVLWRITWPAVKPTTVILAVLQLVGFSSGALDLALIMTGGGPLGSTRSLGLYAYERAFAYQEAGYSSALSVLQLVLIVSIVVIGRWAGSRSRA